MTRPRRESPPPPPPPPPPQGAAERLAERMATLLDVYKAVHGLH